MSKVCALLLAICHKHAASICAARRVYSDLKQGPHNNEKPSLQDALINKTIQAMAEGKIYGRRIETNTESTIEALLWNSTVLWRYAVIEFQF